MKAVRCNRLGPPDSLVIEDLPSPTAGPNEIVMTVKAAAVNFPDGLVIQGKHQSRPEPPFTPGWEVAGVVKDVGAGVTGIVPGQPGVAMIKNGGFAEEALVPAHRFWALPEEKRWSAGKIDFVAAASFPLAYGTSYHSLKDRARLQPAETLLVLGAAGGVGIAAVQFGKLMGARIIACASTAEKLDVCKRHGADELVNYTSEDLREAIKRLTNGRGVDVVLDPVGGRYAEPAVRGMAWNGRYLVVGFTDGSIPRIPLNLPLLKGCSLVGVAWHTFSERDRAGGVEDFREMAEWIASGQLKPLVSATYPLAEAARALNEVMERRVVGKVVLTT